MTKIIEVVGVRKQYSDIVAVDDISFTVAQGESVALLGHNGAGKTTLMEMIGGLRVPDSGYVRLFGKSWQCSASEIYQDIGVAFQETHFTEKLTVWETLCMFASFYRLDKERVRDTLKTVKLEKFANEYVVLLSGGQRQRMVLGLALLHQPRLLVLDEPSTGLDPMSRRELWDILLELKASNSISLVMTSHYMEEASVLCERIIIMEQGRVIAEGTLDSLQRSFLPDGVIDFTLSKPFLDFYKSNLSGVLRVVNEKNKTRLVVRDVAESLPELLRLVEVNNATFQSLECKKATLDDLYVSITSERSSHYAS